MNESISRRTALTGVSGMFGLAGLMSGVSAAQKSQKNADASGGPIQKSLSASVGHGGEYLLPPLPYGYDMLEPAIDAETMKLHHDKHHAAYVKGANEALGKLADIRGGKIEPGAVSEWSEKLAFNLSGHLLHAIFWGGMGPKGSEPKSSLATDINEHFGSVKKFQVQFSAAATQVQGNGWGILAYEPIARHLIVLQTHNHQLTVAWTAIPLLVLDMWEHAYCLKYRNFRADYVKAFWGVVNWDAVDQWYEFVKSSHGGSDHHHH